MRFALAPLLVALAAAAARPADPPSLDALTAAKVKVKARRAALDRLAGPHPAFDLTYFPRSVSETQALVGLRPNLLAAHPDLAPTVGGLDSFGTEAVSHTFYGNPAGSGLAGFDQLLLCGNVNTSNLPPDEFGEDFKPAVLAIAVSGFVARTAKPFDWPAALRVCFPTSKSAIRTYNGATYHDLDVLFLGLFKGLPDSRFGIGFYIGPDLSSDMALYAAPDGRTLVVDSVPRIHSLLDRLRAGQTVAPPPGWDKIDRSAVAVAIDNRNKPWVTALPRPPGPVSPVDASRLFLATDHLALGLDLGPVTRYRALAFCRDPFQARHAQRGVRALVQRAGEFDRSEGKHHTGIVSNEVDGLVDDLLKNGRVTPTPLGYEFTGEVPGDMIGLFARAIEAASKLPPAPTRKRPEF